MGKFFLVIIVISIALVLAPRCSLLTSDPVIGSRDMVAPAR
jgi:hypothetical protein